MPVPLPFIYHFWLKRYVTLTNGSPLVYLPLDYSTPVTYKFKQYSHKVCVRNILMKGSFKYVNDRFAHPFTLFDS